MPQVQLNEQIFRAAQRGAKAGGYSTVADYLADLVLQDRAGESAGYDHLFTAELVTRLDQISSEIKADGKAYTMAEVKELLEGKRDP